MRGSKQLLATKTETLKEQRLEAHLGRKKFSECLGWTDFTKKYECLGVVLRSLKPRRGWISIMDIHMDIH